MPRCHLHRAITARARMQLVGSTCGPADDFPRACISIYPHARATCSHLYSSLRHARTPPSSTDVTLVCVCCGMTVGVMVGGHGREWAACVAPTTAHSESCTPATGVTQPAITPVVHITAGEDLPRAVSTRACPARDLCLSLTQEKFRQRRRAHEPTLGLQVSRRDCALVILLLYHIFVITPAAEIFSLFEK